MKLLAKEKLLIAYCHQQADIPLANVASQLKLKIHNVRYILNRLKEQGIMWHPMPFINPLPLGLIDFTIYFSLAPKSNNHPAQLVAYLKEQKYVSWIGKIGGSYQYGISIISPRPEPVSVLLHNISQKFGDIVHRKSLVIRNKFHAYRRKYLGALPKNILRLSYEWKGEPQRIDEIDTLILSTMSKYGKLSTRELGAILKMPHSSVANRIRSLEKRGVIIGYIYRVNLSNYGISTYKLLIGTAGINNEKGISLINFCSSFPNVIRLSETMGKWDFEVDLEVEDPDQISNFIYLLQSRFQDFIEEVEVLQVLKHEHFASFNA